MVEQRKQRKALTKVESSNISGIAFDEGLIVEYKSGAKYRYQNVPESVYKKLMESESKGRFMNAEIKGKYAFERICE